jgi:transposase
MFIREITKKDQAMGRGYVYHRLMEAVRTPRGPRQRIVLNLGRLDLPKDQWKTLANRIEEILSGQKTLWALEPSIENLAHQFARRIKRRESQCFIPPKSEESPPQWETVDLASLAQEEVRTVGGEAIGHWAFTKVGFTKMFSELGLTQRQTDVAALLIIGRLLHPGSERETFLWGRQVSALDEVLETNFDTLSLSALYRTSDELVRHREEIESRLVQNERSLFHLGESIVLYDLTNTYLTGSGCESSKAHRGRSKQKRHDCPLLTLALVLDEDGFPKASRLFEGNVSEPTTLAYMLDALPKPGQLRMGDQRPTVVMDAGVATAENLALIREREMDYVCVSRSRPREVPQGERTVLKNDSSATVCGIRLEREGEVFLYCESTGRAAKEESMKSTFQKRFEGGLQAISDSLKKKRGIKSYDKVLERVGRLREKYPSISRFYEITVEREQDLVISLTWSLQDEQQLALRFSGAYFIRSSRKDLDEVKLWSLYNTLTMVEDSFRSLKSELGLRPSYHRVDRRLEGHFFITVCAYHLLATIQRELKKHQIIHRWETIRTLMATQCRATVSMTNSEGDRIHIRQTTEAEPFHQGVYRALGLPLKPLKPTKTVA